MGIEASVNERHVSRKCVPRWLPPLLPRTECPLPHSADGLAAAGGHLTTQAAAAFIWLERDSKICPPLRP